MCSPQRLSAFLQKRLRQQSSPQNQQVWSSRVGASCVQSTDLFQRQFLSQQPSNHQQNGPSVVYKSLFLRTLCLRLRVVLLPTTFLLSIHSPCKEIRMLLMLRRSTHTLRMLPPWLRVRCSQLLLLSLIRYANTPFLQAYTDCGPAQLPSLCAIGASSREFNGLPADDSRLLHSRSLT